MPDLYSNVHLVLRWLHVIAGITWVGHLYFFNFVNIPLQGALDDATRKAVNPQLMPRALWWFRWGAMITFLAGLALFVLTYFYTPGVGFGPTSLLMLDGKVTDRAMWILFGMLLATAMWYNVWMIIWPAQKRLLTGKVPQE
ncbi:MAG: urate hydroxylase PuuD, partial [Candidatus Omnitrophica bacterium]|nr:urate hydroxylase PuuD [Candidatus Omnitrophota bacterium]